MSVRRTNATTPKISRGSSIPSNKIKIKTKPAQIKKNPNKECRLIDKKRNIKVDYNSNNYFYNEEDYVNDYPYNKVEYYDRREKDRKYNKETNDSYITVEHEDGHMKYYPKNYVDYKSSSRPYNNKKVDYEENSDDYDYNCNKENDNDNDNVNMYYENDEVYEQNLLNNRSINGFSQFKGINKYFLTQENSNNNTSKLRKSNQNVISRPISHQINFTKDAKRKGRTPGGNIHNVGNTSTTTNNTYNNNIYYINPINVNNKDKNKKEEIDNKTKRLSNTKKNTVYKNVDLTLTKRKPIKERDYFRLYNVERSQRIKYIEAATLIQSIFRGYMIKIKLYNNVNLYVCCKRSIDLLQKMIYKKKKIFWKFFKSKISHMFYNDLLNSKVSLNILKQYLKNNKTNPKEKKFTSFHKELGDSFNIVVDNKQKENTEKKLKSKLNDVIKENNQLKNQLIDNKNIEEKMKNLIDENKKNQNINAIIMKDNQQLAKKLKDIQDYRNINLLVENQLSVDLKQEKQMHIEELLNNNTTNTNKLKTYLLGKFIYKKINKNKYDLKNKFDNYKSITEKIKNKENEKKIILNNALNIIQNAFKLIKQKYFWNLYYIAMLLDKEKQSKNILKNTFLKKIINNKDKNTNKFLSKQFFKYYSNAIKIKDEDLKKQQEQELEKEQEENKKMAKTILLTKIFKRYRNNIKLIYKIFLEKWFLKAKILGIRAAARDKKKKRKLKKKNNKLTFQKNFGIADKKTNNSNGQFSKSIHEFSYIVSNGAVIKESSSNDIGLNTKNSKGSISSDKVKKVNKLGKNKNLGIIKTNSVNEIATKNNLIKDNKENENINCNEDSDEDSGDSFGLDENNSD